jgi:adenylate kinase
MLLIFLGAPASGKGTQAEKIAKYLSIPHISMGEILRQNIKRGTFLGKKAAEIINKGNLLPDSVVFEVIKDRLEKDDCSGGALLDGYPRTVEQAKLLQQLIKTDIVIFIDVEKEHLLNRILGRRVCEVCGKNVHIDIFSGDICECGGSFIQRDDDTEEIFESRLEIYKESTLPLVDFYLSQGLLKIVDGEGTPEEVTLRIKNAIDAI